MSTLEKGNSVQERPGVPCPASVGAKVRSDPRRQAGKVIPEEESQYLALIHTGQYGPRNEHSRSTKAASPDDTDCG